MKKNILLILFLSTIQITFANDKNIEFERISTEQGLSHNIVNCIIQDNKGFIWVGTEDGLNKYYGYGFIVYKYNPLDSNSISSNFITSICEDREGTLWVGTAGGGLNKFDREKEIFKHYKHNPNNPKSICSNNIAAIYEDKYGILWIGASDKGLDSFDKHKEIFTNYSHNPNNPSSLSDNNVRRIYEDKSGTLWIGTRFGGLNKFDRENKTFTSYKHNPSNSNSLSNNWVTSIYEDKTGNFWIGTDSGLNKFDREKGTFIHYSYDANNSNGLASDWLKCIYQDRKGRLWIGSWAGGLSEFDFAKGIFTHYKNDPGRLNSLSDNDVLTIYEDKSGILWIGTSGGGINKIANEKKNFLHYKHTPDNPYSIGHNTIRAIYEDNSGSLWVGTFGGIGLGRLIPEKGFIHYTDKSNNLSGSNVLSIYQDEEGTLWVGTSGGGLNKFNRSSKDTLDGFFTHYKNDPNNPNSLINNYVTAIYKDRSDIMWIGTENGLDRFDNGNFTHFQNDPNNPNSLSANSIQSNAIYEDDKGRLWIGTYGGGLNRFDKADRDALRNHFKHYKHDVNNPNSLSNDNVLSIYEDEFGNFWIGTYGGGLNKFDREKEIFTHFTEKDGLASNSIYGVLGDDKGNLWLSTNNGLSKFNIKTQTFRNYDIRDGLQSNEFFWGAFHKGKSGKLYFGGVGGLNVFYPDSIKDNPNIPPIIITSFKKFNKEFKFDKTISEIKEIKLSYKDNFFSFEFASLDYTNPSKNKYAYKLEGFNKDWIYCGNDRVATYTNLGGGKYTFKVKGSNNDGIWNEEGTSIKIIITPPLWKTLWAYIFYVASIVGGVILYVRYRIREQSKKLEEERIKLKAREKELEQEKLLAEQKQKLTIIQQELDIARRIQRSIIPDTCPQLPGLDISVCYIPMASVAGDFYDFHLIDNKRLGVLMTDVSGHGVPAALIASMVKIAFSLQKDVAHNPSMVLKNMDRILFGKCEEQYLTLIYIYIDMEKRKLLYASAGHLPLLIWKKQKQDMKILRKTGLAMGWFPDVEWSSVDIDIEEGDRIVLYTDGIIESRDPSGKLFGENRLINLIKEKENLSVSEFTNSVLNQLTEWVGKNKGFDDDLTMINIDILKF